MSYRESHIHLPSTLIDNCGTGHSLGHKGGGLANGESDILNHFLVDMRTKMVIRRLKELNTQRKLTMWLRMPINVRLRALERLQQELDKL